MTTPTTCGAGWSRSRSRHTSVAGGLHHAGRGHAAGFCVFNDLGVVIETLRSRYGVKRIAYIDIDVHFGDGVFYAFESDPDVIIEGSLLTLARMAGTSGESAVRDGTLDLTGNAETAQAFQELLAFAKPDIEEQLSTLLGDVAAHRLGEITRGIGDWARDARSTMGSNIREYLQEESRDLPSRYEVERFTQQVDSLRDGVARLEARLNRLTGGS